MRLSTDPRHGPRGTEDARQMIQQSLLRLFLSSVLSFRRGALWAVPRHAPESLAEWREPAGSRTD